MLLPPMLRQCSNHGLCQTRKCELNIEFCLFRKTRRLMHGALTLAEKIKKPELALVDAACFGSQLLDAIEGNLFGCDERALRLHRPNETFLNEMEFADRLARQRRRRVETRFRLEGGFQLPQCGVLADAPDEPARDLIAALVVEIAGRLRREHHAEPG